MILLNKLYAALMSEHLHSFLEGTTVAQQSTTHGKRVLPTTAEGKDDDANLHNYAGEGLDNASTRTHSRLARRNKRITDK